MTWIDLDSVRSINLDYITDIMIDEKFDNKNNYIMRKHFIARQL